MLQSVKNFLRNLKMSDDLQQVLSTLDQSKATLDTHAQRVAQLAAVAEEKKKLANAANAAASQAVKEHDDWVKGYEIQKDLHNNRVAEAAGAIAEKLKAYKV